MKLFIIILLSISFVFFACKKKCDDHQLPQTDYSRYYPMAVGNYWIYQWFDVDTNGSATPVQGGSKLDTFTIKSDTIINGKIYFVIEKKQHWLGNNITEYLRDSSYHLINERGSVFFSAVNFTDTFSYDYDSLTTLIYFNKMIRDTFSVFTPIGNFEGLSCRRTAYSKELNFFPSCQDGAQHSDNIYVPDVGFVRNNRYFTGVCYSWYERRLIAYQLN